MGLIDNLPDTRRVRLVESKSEFVAGLDLGQQIDPSAIAVIEKRVEGVGEFEVLPNKIQVERSRQRNLLRHLERLPLRTRYPDIVAYIAEKMAAPPLDGKATLVVDQTGVGRPVVDLFREIGLRPIAVTLTAGDAEKRERGDWRVPKTRLVNVLDAGLSAGELEIAANLPDYETFEDELGDFRRRISDTGRLSFGAREGKHDDTIIAVGLALWWATRKPRGVSERVRVRGV